MTLSDFAARRAIADLVAGRKIYDLGCGTAPFVKDLYDRSDYIGIDCSEQVLAIAMQCNPFYKFSRHDLSKGPVPVPDGLVEVATMIDVLVGFEDFEVALYVLEEARRISRELLVVWSRNPSPWPRDDLRMLMPSIKIRSVAGFDCWSVA